jgi:hypothetical protein
MICLAAANVRVPLASASSIKFNIFPCQVFGALQAYSTGNYVPAPEFSQGRLEGTYLSLVQFIDDQYAGSEANIKAFHKIMHQLYLNAS